jgi:hypothetical protein
LTKGTITGVNAAVQVRYSSGIAKFVEQIIVESNTAFIKPGDSGSLLVTDPDANSVGLLFAGNSEGTLAVANEIRRVLDGVAGPEDGIFEVTIDGETAPPPPPPTTGSISGTVTKAADGTPIGGATISVDTGQSATTDASGAYTITNVPTGTRSVTASASGFESQTKTATVNENQTTIVDFALNATPPPPPTPTLSITVVTDKPTYVNREMVTITVTVTDGTNPVSGAAAHVEIQTANGKFALVGDGSTNENGVARFKYKVNSNRDGIGTYTVNVIASKAGFNSGSGSTTFQVTQ